MVETCCKIIKEHEDIVVFFCIVCDSKEQVITGYPDAMDS
jgi:hypothetical protein